MSPALILLLYEQSERDMAQAALLTMEATLAATGVSWLKKGQEIYKKTAERLQRLAGYGKGAPARNDAKANRKKLGAKLAALGLPTSGKPH